MPHLRILVTAVLAAALLLTGCSRTPPNPAPGPSTAGQGTAKQRTDLTAPFERTLKDLLAMNASGKQKDIPGAQGHFQEFRTHWTAVKPELAKVDPKLAEHIEQGAVELDVEFAKPAAEFRFYELDEETVKLGRLLSQGAELLKAPIDPALVQKDPTQEIPYNKEVEVAVTLVEHKIQPEVITVDQHDKVTFVVTNKGKEVHEFVLDHYAVELEEVKPGETKRLTVTVLDAGEFETACHIPGHYEVGQFGKLIVKPAELKQK
jgi:uncharacterized cupredoxin-like copper-binding protein